MLLLQIIYQYDNQITNSSLHIINNLHTYYLHYQYINSGRWIYLATIPFDMLTIHSSLSIVLLNTFLLLLQKIDPLIRSQHMMKRLVNTPSL